MLLVAATNNKKKLAELQRILLPMGHEVKTLSEMGLDIDPEEDGDTFAANALIKARAVCAACGEATVADDSGLVVDALGGAPGVYSARYAGGHGDDGANNEKLLRELADVAENDRTARFVSAVALVLPGGVALVAEGACEGLIGYEEKGDGGFGYDPLFYVEGRSFAEFTAAEKDAVSHRGKALRKLADRLPGFLEENRDK